MNNSLSLLLALTVPSIAGESSTAKEVIPFPDTGAKGIITPTKAESPWSIRSGISWRSLGKTSIDPGFRSSATFASSFFSPNPASGPLGQNSNRTYDDGFVNLGAATPGTGLTTNWGYSDENQLIGDTIQYTLGGGVALDFPTSGQAGDDTGISPYVELVYLRPYRKDLDLGFVANFFYTGLDSNIRNQMNQYSVTTTDRFALGGVVAPLAPYTGNFSGPGPLIPNQPGDRSQIQALNGSQTFLFENETRLFSFGFGTELLWHPAERCHLSLGSGIVVNIADWESQTSVPMIAANTTTVSNSVFRNSETDVLLGLYLKLGAGYEINENWNIEGFFRYDWSEDLEAKVGPTSFEVDLSGWTLGFGAGYSF